MVRDKREEALFSVQERNGRFGIAISIKGLLKIIF